MDERRKVYAIIDYEDQYVHPLILAAVRARLPPDLLILIKDTSELPDPGDHYLQWRQYESIEFENLLSHPSSTFANSYVIRKALIRKHYLSATVARWTSKHPDTQLRNHVKPSVDFEVDYAEFLDDALVEAWDLKESWRRNEGKNAAEREWWILKPGMSDRGQGIRLFSSETELTEIFEGWEPEGSDDDESGRGTTGDAKGDGIMTSQLRHFVAQPYIHPPLLLQHPHANAGRKFHIRTYVLAVGALQVYIYRPMLALFTSSPYSPPSSSSGDLSKHLTNTCLQSGEREGSVDAFWSLPQEVDKDSIFAQVCDTTATIFEAAARSMGIHFQPVPNAFEIFGVDFLVDAKGTAWLLELNSFPDFAQTGEELRGLVQGLLEAVVDVGVKPFFFGGNGEQGEKGEEGTMRKVLDIDLGRR